MPFTPDDALDDSAEPKPSRSTVASRRRAWVIEALTAGRTHPDIADALGISRERVRQIAKEALAGHSVEPEREHIHVQITRLIPALTLAAQAVDRGNVKAIAPLLKILERLDGYQARVLMLDMPDLDPEVSAGAKKFDAMIGRIKEDFDKMGLADIIETRAEAYVAAQILAESQNARDARAGQDAPPTAPDDLDLDLDQSEKANRNAASD